MNAILLSTVTLFFTAAPPSPPPVTVDSLAFMTGTWEGEMDAVAGRVVIEEHWTPVRAGTLFGVSRTIVDGKTVAFEFLRIETRDDGIFYVAQPGGRPATDFRLTESGGSWAQFENPEHDHPKIIRYEKHADGSLSARIEGEEKGKHVEQTFHFRPLGPSP